VRRRVEGPEGVGLGLRWDFLEEVLDGPDLDVAFFEVCPENYMKRGGWYPAALEQISERYTVVTHGLTASLGGSEPIDAEYLCDLHTETQRLGTPWHSDHLAMTRAGSRVLHELLPLKLCRASVDRVVDRVRELQDALGLPIAVENVTWYAHPGQQEMPESEFVSEVVERANCSLLLDVNNAWVNSQNHGFDAREFISQLPLGRVIQIHVAGHTRTDSGLILDTHGAPLVDPVIDLLEWTIERTGPMPVLLERDNFVPELSELMREVALLREAYERGLQRRRSPLARTA
jgi:hypothetical protein